MYDKILCTCGRDIGCYTLAYRESVRLRYADILGAQYYDPQFLPDWIGTVHQTGDILDSLGLTLVCCRMRIMCNVRFHDIY